MIQNRRSYKIIPMLAGAFSFSADHTVNLSEFSTKYGIGASTLSKFTARSKYFESRGSYGVRFIGDDTREETIRKILYENREEYSAYVAAKREREMAENLVSSTPSPIPQPPPMHQAPLPMGPPAQPAPVNALDQVMRRFDTLENYVHSTLDSMAMLNRQNEIMMLALEAICKDLGIAVPK